MTSTRLLISLMLSLISTAFVLTLRFGHPFRLDELSSSKGGDSSTATTYSYRGRDYARHWLIPPLKTVELSHEDSVHYRLETELGIAEWNKTLPSGGALLRLGPDFRPFTLSMFHQLRCLDIIRAILVSYYLDESPDATFGKRELAEHCMNYLRQIVLCRADLRLEHVRAASGPKVTMSEVTHQCQDWTAVYEAAEENYEVYLQAIETK